MKSVLVVFVLVVAVAALVCPAYAPSAYSQSSGSASGGGSPVSVLSAWTSNAGNVAQLKAFAKSLGITNYKLLSAYQDPKTGWITMTIHDYKTGQLSIIKAGSPSKSIKGVVYQFQNLGKPGTGLVKEPAPKPTPATSQEMRYVTPTEKLYGR